MILDGVDVGGEVKKKYDLKDLLCFWWKKVRRVCYVC